MPTKKSKSFGKPGTPSVPNIFKKKTSPPKTSGIDTREPYAEPHKTKKKEE